MRYVCTHEYLGGMSPQDLGYLYNFALMVPLPLVRNLTELHFTMVPVALLRCPPKHFGRIAAVDGGSAPYCKVALVVACYLGAAGDKGKVQTEIAGVSALCNGVKKEAVDQMKKEPDVLKRGDPWQSYQVQSGNLQERFSRSKET